MSWLRYNFKVLVIEVFFKEKKIHLAKNMWTSFFNFTRAPWGRSWWTHHLELQSGWRSIWKSRDWRWSINRYSQGLCNRDTKFAENIAMQESWLCPFSLKSMTSLSDLFRLSVNTLQCLLFCVVKEGLTFFTGYTIRELCSQHLWNAWLWVKSLTFLHNFSF